jgi:hypothetical protein
MLFGACGGGDDSKRSDTTDSTGNGGTSFVKPPKSTVQIGTTTLFVPDTLATTAAPETEPATTLPQVIPLTGKIDDIIIRESVADLNQWWTSEFNQVYPGKTYSPPTAGVWTLRSDTVLQCDDETVTYERVANNAKYIRCGSKLDNDMVIFDLESLIPDLVRTAGQFAPAFVGAHEWAHLVQNRGSDLGEKTINKELQADCYAGGWVRHVIADGTPFPITTDDIDTALSALIQIGDAAGSDPNIRGAHGSSFDRVSAFSTGLENIQACVNFQTNPPPVFEMQFTTASEQQTGGNLDLVTLTDLAEADLNRFFTTEVDPNYPIPNFVEGPCNGELFALAYCASDGSVHFDRDRLNAIHTTFGDFATVVLMARAYTDPLKIDRQVSNCVVGAFVHTLFLDASNTPPTYNLQLSPGDLDEAVRVFLVESQNGDGIVSVANLRTGVIQGLPACAALAGN